jgi:hypothetical protein
MRYYLNGQVEQHEFQQMAVEMMTHLSYLTNVKDIL